MTDSSTLAAPDLESEPAPRRVRTLVLVLSVVAALLAAACVALFLVARAEKSDRADLRSAREAASRAAGELVVNLDALSSGTVDADMKRVVLGSTGTFKTQFTKSQAELRDYIVKQKISSEGELQSVAVIRSDTDTATVLVAVDRTFKDATHKDGVVANDRWKLDLEKHGGRWLVADLEPVA
ncbi:MAG: putative rane protein [Frankiales bacterium]|nr:putative rane protein [Frankiales bacterium]